MASLSPLNITTLVRIRSGGLHMKTTRAIAGRATLSTTSKSTATTKGPLETEDHQMLRQTVQKFVATEINPYVDEWEKKGIFPAKKLFKKAGDLGLLGLSKPTKFGGQALDYSFEVVFAEELGNATCGAVPMALGVQSNMATPALAKFGSDDVRERFLKPTIAGDMVACLGVSEVGAGSDVSAITTRAVRHGDEFVVNGSKMWTTNGTQADWMCLLANTASAAEVGGPHKNKSLICLPMNTAGITVTKVIDKLGMRSSDTAQIHFDNVRVPVANVIGEINKGFIYQMIQFQEERLYASATVIKAMELCINSTVEYASQRKIFGKSVLDNQVVHYKLAEMATEIECLRALIYRATEKYIQGEDVTYLASMCKLKAGKLSRYVTDGTLQFWGGMGFTNEVVVSRMYRDHRLTSIGGGSDETMLAIIAKMRKWSPK